MMRGCILFVTLLPLPLLLLASTTSNGSASAFSPANQNNRNQYQRYMTNNNQYLSRDDNDNWSLICLGDLHMEDDMTLHEQARQDCLQTVQDYSITGTSSTPLGNNNRNKDHLQTLEQRPAGDLTTEELEFLLTTRKQQEQQQQQLDGGDLAPTIPKNTHLVSLGDLGRGNKHSRHEPGDAGTSQCFQKAKEYLDGFTGITSYDLVTGNHDLEALEEFKTDQDNLKAWMHCFEKSQPQFHTYVGAKTLLLGLSTVQFREAPYSSHEVHVDDQQIEWFQHMVESHSFEDGWKILVFSHAPILGSGLMVLQNVHVTSGCAWLNHCSLNRNRFIELVQQNPQIKCWASGHFHLSHELKNTLVQHQVGSCTFVQVGVIGAKSTRDGRRQTRFFRGCGDDCIEIYSINHHVRVPTTTTGVSGDDQDGNTKAEVRLDATIDLKSGRLIHAHEEISEDALGASSSTTTTNTTSSKDQKWFQAYVPQEEDGCYLEDVDGSIGDISSGTVCWWHMADGKVLGVHRGQVVEYDASTLAPLGVVVLEEQLNNREVMIVQNKTVLVLVDDNTQDIEVVHPNADGSYWRKLSQSKVIRLEEQAREEVAKRWMEQKQQKRQQTEEKTPIN